MYYSLYAERVIWNSHPIEVTKRPQCEKSQYLLVFCFKIENLGREERSNFFLNEKVTEDEVTKRDSNSAEILTCNLKARELAYITEVRKLQEAEKMETENENDK